MDEVKPFEFRQCLYILKSTARKARDLRELRAAIPEVSDNCIFHHTCQFFLKEYDLKYTNDFARWVGEFLKEDILAEQLSNIDPFTYNSIDELRNEISKIMDQYLIINPQLRLAPAGDEFYLNESIAFVFSAGIQAKNLAEFLMAISHVNVSSIYYHFYEARVRLGGMDDFSNWFEYGLGKKALAERMKTIDIFMQNLEGTRKNIIGIVEEEIKKEMEKF